MAAGASRVLTMLLHPIAQRARLAILSGIFERWYVGWRRRGRRAEHIGEKPFASQHNRRPVWIRRDGKNACLTEQAAANTVVECHSPEMIAVDIRDHVMTREPLVQV